MARGPRRYKSLSSSWFTAFALMLGEFDPETYMYRGWMFFFFHYFAIFVNIVLLNVLIAIISDTCAIPYPLAMSYCALGVAARCLLHPPRRPVRSRPRERCWQVPRGEEHRGRARAAAAGRSHH